MAAQLTDSETGRRLWGDTFEKPIADLFDLQDEIVAQLANTLKWKLFAEIAIRTERKPNPDSTDLLLQGRAWYNKGSTLENLSKARECYQRALDADQNNLAALSGTSFSAADRVAKLACAEAMLTKVLALRPDDAWAHVLLGDLEINTNRAAAELERALALDPNLPLAQALLGYAMLVNGRADEAETHVKEALRLSPRDPYGFYWVGWTAAAKLFSGYNEEAVELSRRSIELNRNNGSYFGLAAALQLLGRPDEARKEDRASAQSEIQHPPLSRGRTERQSRLF